MAEIIKGRFYVIKYEDINKALSEDERTSWACLALKIDQYRSTQGKHQNDYYVVNQEEPYAKEVLRIILAGEDAKGELTEYRKILDLAKKLSETTVMSFLGAMSYIEGAATSLARIKGISPDEALRIVLDYFKKGGD